MNGDWVEYVQFRYTLLGIVIFLVWFWGMDKVLGWIFG